MQDVQGKVVVKSVCVEGRMEGELIFDSGFPCVVPECSLFHKMISML